MISENTKNLIIGFLEAHEGDFAMFLDLKHRIDPCEAGVIIDELKQIIPYSCKEAELA